MDRYYQEVLVVPHGTAIANPVTQDVVLENNDLVDIELIVPSGHSGFTGIRILSSDQQIVPWGNDSWMVRDDYVRVFPYNDEVGANAISLQGYNTDTIDHTFYVVFHITNLMLVSQSPGQGGTGGSTGLGGITSTGTGSIVPPTLNPTPITPPTLPAPPTVAPPTLPGSPVANLTHAHQQYSLLNM